jgi:hypothetical protein
VKKIERKDVKNKTSSTDSNIQKFAFIHSFHCAEQLQSWDDVYSLRITEWNEARQEVSDNWIYGAKTPFY